MTTVLDLCCHILRFTRFSPACRVFFKPYRCVEQVLLWLPVFFFSFIRAVVDIVTKEEPTSMIKPSLVLLADVKRWDLKSGTRSQIFIHRSPVLIWIIFSKSCGYLTGWMTAAPPVPPVCTSEHAQRSAVVFVTGTGQKTSVRPPAMFFCIFQGGKYLQQTSY